MVIATCRQTQAHINLAAIQNNFCYFKQQYPNSPLYATIKADAYGHGASRVAKALSEVQVDGFCVACEDEALELRAAGLLEPILILGPILPCNAPLLAKKDIAVAAPSLAWLQAVKACLKEARSCPPLAIHLALDTGMGRIGWQDFPTLKAALAWVQEEACFHLAGAFTHYATADQKDQASLGQVAEQAKRFAAFKTQCQATYPKLLWHEANSALALWHPDLIAPGEMLRLGIVLYGLSPNNKRKSLPEDIQPALSWQTALTHVKQCQAGTTISYGATYRTEAAEWIGTLPVGYADGLPRHATGYHVLIAGQACPIVGRVCMDQCMVRLPQAYPLGTIAQLIGQSEDKEQTAEDLAKHLGTINYEVLTNLSPRVQRIYRTGAGKESDSRAR